MKCRGTVSALASAKPGKWGRKLEDGSCECGAPSTETQAGPNKGGNMRPMRWLTCLAIAGLIVACDDTGIDPQVADTEATFKVDRVTETEAVIDDPYVGYIDCANDGQGEWTEWWGTIVYHRTIMDTPSGNSIRSSRWEFTGLPAEHPEYKGPDYVLIGQTSGDFWVMDAKKTKFLEKRVNFADGSWGYHQTMNMFFTRDDGERLHVQGTYQLKMVDGEWKMFHVNRGSCPEIW